MILIITDEFDAHADEVIKSLKKLRSKFFRLNLDVNSLNESHIIFKNGEWKIEQFGEKIRSNEIKCVWARKLTVSLTLEQKNISDDNSFKIWKSEWNRSLYGLYTYIRDIPWMNPIRDSSIIDNKFYQLDLAEKIGFSVPPYINSNKKKELIEFIRNNNPAAIKFMSQEIYTMPDGTFKGIYVNKINEIDLNDFQETSENPITIQKYIRKSFEVRHTYVDGYHFSCKIESQKSTISNVDWRRYDIKNTPHIPIEAPDEIKKLVEELMNHSNLIYGAFDFIVDDDNKWWYLEVNTSGQWLWIEDLAGLPISGRIAEALNARLKGDS